MHLRVVMIFILFIVLPVDVFAGETDQIAGNNNSLAWQIIIPVFLGYFLSQFQQYIAWRREKHKQLGLPLIEQLQKVLSKVGNLEIIPKENINNISYYINPKGKKLEQLSKELYEYNTSIINLRYGIKLQLHQALIIDVASVKSDNKEKSEEIDAASFPWLFHMLDKDNKFMIERLVEYFLHHDTEDRILADNELSSYVNEKFYNLCSDGLAIFSIVKTIKGEKGQVFANEYEAAAVTKKRITNAQEMSKRIVVIIQNEITKLIK